MTKLKSFISVLFVLLMFYIIVVLFCFDYLKYYIKTPHLLSNIFSLLFIVPLFICFYLFYKNTRIKKKTYYKLIGIISITAFLLQFIIVKYGTFYTGWDAGLIFNLSEKIFYSKTSVDMAYLTMYPNNVFLTFIFVLIKKIPFIGTKYITTLVINCILVNISGICASLTINNISKERTLSLLSYIIITPLILLSPWILIPYSDTFAILFPILVIYIYSKENKKIYHYFLIGMFSIMGFLIKPTVIIVLIAIVIIEILQFFTNFKINIKLKLKQYLIAFIFLILGICLSYSLKYVSRIYINFKPDKKTQEFNITHFLAMGQNDHTDGVYSAEDVNDSMNYGMNINIEKFKKRFFSRTLKEQISFFSRKTLINYNEPAFAWGHEGNFYLKVFPEKNKMEHLIRMFYYKTGKYYRYFMLSMQWLWLLTVFFCPYIVTKDNKKAEYAIMLSILGITLFLSIFECRTRYLYCFSPIYVACGTLGINQLKNIIKHIRGDSK